jgi:hypothetical protein
MVVIRILLGALPGDRAPFSEGIGRVGSQSTRFAVLVAFSVATAGMPSNAQAQAPKLRAQSGFDLRAGTIAVLDANRVHCGLDAYGKVCADISSIVGGGFWPKGTPDQYIFNSGLQLAALIPTDAGFEWAGDTTGVFLVDGRTRLSTGKPISAFFDSRDPLDLADWPSAAVVRRMRPSAELPDTSLYHDVLLGRRAVSEQDLWIRIWDGTRRSREARAHPMGVLVELRAMVWNHPSGNEDIVYLVYTLYNITASDPAVYQHLDPAVRDGIVDIGRRFHDEVRAAHGVELPAGGYRFDEMHAAVWMDPDVGSWTRNYSTANLPFETSLAYKANFEEPQWRYPPEIFGAPFAPHPGIVGAKFLGTPEQAGLAIFTNFGSTSTGFPNPDGVEQLWRYLSGNVTPAAGDNPCDFPNPRERQLCVLWDWYGDTWFQQSTGPFTLGPGEFTTFAMAYVFAAPVRDALIASGEIGGALKPLIPFPGDSILNNTCSDRSGSALPCVRALDSVAGWVSASDLDGDGSIEQQEVQTVPRSFLHKAQVAQAFFDNGFLTPRQPDPVSFFPVAGDNQVTIVWERSGTEQAGDPYFSIASDPTSALYDPNFRQFDVEGYRIYRGRSPNALELIAQFDYSGTHLVDYTGSLDYGDQCAPELGIHSSCPVDFAGGESYDRLLVSDVVQLRPGWRVEFSPGVTAPLIADTAVTGGASGFPRLAETEVPFLFVDDDVSNGFTYHYAVTAFDVNSILSGPSSLESPLVSQSTMPRSTAANKVAADDVTLELIDRDGNALDPAAAYPTIDAATGTFSGPMPPSGAFEGLGAQLLADNLVTPGLESFVEVDSVVPFYYHDGTYYLHGTAMGIASFAPGLPLGQEDGPAVMGPIEGLLEANSALADSLGLGPVPWAGKFSAQVTVNAVTYQSKDADWHPQVEGLFFDPQDPPLVDANGAVDYGGSRWFDGANETMAHPTLLGGHGMLTGVTAIYSPAPFAPWENADAHTRRPMQTVYHGFRAADMQVYWGAPGVIDSVGPRGRASRAWAAGIRQVARRARGSRRSRQPVVSCRPTPTVTTRTALRVQGSACGSTARCSTSTLPQCRPT